MIASAASTIAIIASIGLGAALVLSGKQRSLNSALLATGLLLMAMIECADLVALNDPQNWISAKQVARFFESLAGIAWLLFAVTYARSEPFRRRSPFTWLFLAVALLLPLVVLVSPSADFYFSPDFAEEHVLFLGRSAYWFYFGLLLLSVVALYHLERILMAVSSVERSLLLFEILGVGTILIAMLIYYSQALLHRTIDMNLLPVRSLALLAGSVFCGYSRFIRSPSRDIHVSRNMASQSIVVLAVSFYLLLLGGAGEGLRYFGVQNQRLPLIGFAVISGLLLIIYLLSAKNRRKLKVFLHKHFYRHKYDYRNEWLMFTRQLSSADNLARIQESILDFYCDTFARKGASLYLLDAETGTYRQAASRLLNHPQSFFPPEHPLPMYLSETENWVYNAADSHSSSLEEFKFQHEPFKMELCVPLKHEQGLEGFIMLGEAAHPGETLSYEDYDLMKVLASQATAMVLSLKLSEQLSTAQEMAAIGRVSTFVIHDLKNHASNLSLMMDNARDHIDNPEFQLDMLETLEETVGKMNALIARLKNIKEKKQLNLEACDLSEVVRRGVKEAGAPDSLVATDRVPVFIDAIEIEKVVHNLLLNAFDADASRDAIAVKVGRNGTAFFEVSDDGRGMSEDFIRNRLFKPFQSTKSHGFGIGLYQCRHIVESHGGKIEVFSRPGEGSIFKVHLPLADS